MSVPPNTSPDDPATRPSAAAAPKPGRSRLRRALGVGLALAVMGGTVWGVVSWSGRRSAPVGADEGAPPGPPGMTAGRRAARTGPVPVLAATAATADVPVYFDGVGTARALNSVTVRSQVDGKLLKLNFEEGQTVRKGEVLAEIDPTIYQAQYDQAVAKKAQDEALLANAKIDLERYERLAKSNATSQQQADTQRATVAQYAAQVKADQASIDNQKAYLDYTKVVAPLTGRTGIRLVDVGNLVKAADTTGIVTITQVQPIYVTFTLPQQQLSVVVKAFAHGALPVLALGTDNTTVLDRGLLKVIDNQVDATTGTVKMRGEFPNADLQLWPGQFVNVKLLVDTLKAVVVVPTAAVQRGPDGTFAYVIGKDSTVAVRPVTVAQQDDRQAVIASGLSAGDRIVTTGFSQLSDGKKVTVSGEGGNGEGDTAPQAGKDGASRQKTEASAIAPADRADPAEPAAAVDGEPAAGKPATDRSAAESRRSGTEGSARGSTVR